mgnify:CR=1 FL=1
MKKIILLFICFTIYQINAIENKSNTEEVFIEKTSSVFYIKNDSLFKAKFDKIFKKKENEEYVKALEEALGLLNSCKKEENYYWIYKSMFLIADIYNNTNKFKESLKYNKESLNQLQLAVLENSDSRFTDLDFAKTLLKVGTSYHYLSVSLGEKFKTFYLDSAKTYYEKIENLPALNSKIDNLKATAFSNLSTIYEQDSIFDKAESYVKKAIIINKKNKRNIKIANSLNNLGNIFLSQKKYKKSKEIYTEALEVIKNDNNTSAVRTKASLYYNLAWAMRNLKDYKAYDFQEMSYEIEGDIRERKFKGTIDEITHRYDFDAKKKLLEKQQEVKILTERDKIKTVVIIGIFILVLFLVILRFYNLKQRNLALELTQTKLIQDQNIEKIKSESQVRILNATIDGKESERKDIAETLHDSVSTLLSSANLHLQATRKQFNGKTPVEIDKTQEIILEASHKIRDLSHTLVSSVLLKFGLNFAIKDIAEKYSNSELTIETEINNIRRYQQNFEIKVYNIIQEFLNNILKHSKANNALVELKEEKGSIYFTISDDGIGFDKTKINMKDGLGINQIDARIQIMKGDFFIDSSINNGTKIFVQLPIVEKGDINHV